VKLFDFESQPISRKPQHITWDPIMAERAALSISCKRNFRAAALRSRHIAWQDLAGNGKVFLDEMDISEEEFRNFHNVKLSRAARAGMPAWQGNS